MAILAVAHSEETARRHAVLTVVFVGFVFCASGSLLTVLNKLIMQELHAANALLLLQNSGTLILLVAGERCTPIALEALSQERIIKWSPLVFLFYLMLASSLIALRYVTATTLIVQRNLATVTIAFADYVVLGTKQNFRRVTAIFCMCLGSYAYAHDDVIGTTFDVYGYAWLFINIFSTTAYQIKVKTLVNELGMNSWTMAYYNNVLSLPICVALAAALGEFRAIESAAEKLSRIQILAIGVSSTLGFMLSVSAFQLNRMISPTSITVLNNANKFVLIFFTAYFLDFGSLSQRAVLGIIIVMASAAVYSFPGSR